jgi:hypothetical protein
MTRSSPDATVPGRLLVGIVSIASVALLGGVFAAALGTAGVPYSSFLGVGLGALAVVLGGAAVSGR